MAMLKERVKDVTVLTNPKPPRPMTFSIFVVMEDTLELVVELVDLKSPFKEVADLDKVCIVDSIVGQLEN